MQGGNLNRSNRIAWYIIIFLTGMAEGSIGTFFPLVFVDKGGSYFSLSLFMAFVSLGGFLSYTWGSIIDTSKKPKILATLALAANGASIAVMGISPKSKSFGNARIATSVSLSGFNNANAYLRTAYFPSAKRGKMGSIFMGMNLMGVAISVYLTGVYYDIFGLHRADIVHWIAAGLFFISIILFLLFIPEFDPKYVVDEQLSYAIFEEKANLNYRLTDVIKLAKTSRGLLKFVFASLLFQFAVGISGPFFIIGLDALWGLSNVEIGLILTINTLIQVITIFIFLPIVDIVNRKTVFTFGTLLAIIPIIAMVIPVNQIDNIFQFWVIVHSFSSIGWGIVNSLLVTLVIDYVHPKIRATFLGLFGTLHAISIFLASIIAGLIINWLGSLIVIFFLSLIFRCLGLITLLLTPSPPVASADFYEQRRIFISRFYSTIERGIMFLPVLGKIILQKKD